MLDYYNVVLPIIYTYVKVFIFRSKVVHVIHHSNSLSFCLLIKWQKSMQIYCVLYRAIGNNGGGDLSSRFIYPLRFWHVSSQNDVFFTFESSIVIRFIQFSNTIACRLFWWPYCKTLPIPKMTTLYVLIYASINFGQDGFFRAVTIVKIKVHEAHKDATEAASCCKDWKWIQVSELSRIGTHVKVRFV